jgi:hypothetical protein
VLTSGLGTYACSVRFDSFYVRPSTPSVGVRSTIHVSFAMHTVKPFRTTIILAALLFVFDAFVLNQGFVSLVMILITLCVMLPRALWVYRKNRQLYLTRLTKAAIYLLAAFSVFAADNLQNRIADKRAIALGNGCLAFHAKYNHYPQQLNELVPEFIPHVPMAKSFAGARFMYYSPASGREPMLYYEAIPPFGRRFYHMEKGYWGFLD